MRRERGLTIGRYLNHKSFMSQPLAEQRPNIRVIVDHKHVRVARDNHKVLLLRGGSVMVGQRHPRHFVTAVCS